MNPNSSFTLTGLMTRNYRKTVRLVPLLALVFFQITGSNGQTSLKELNLPSGEYAVGFRHYNCVDSTRTYQIKNEFNNQFGYRPIPISMWYPAEMDTKKATARTVLDYLEILKAEEEWENLPNTFLLDWFPYLWNTPENEAHLSETTNALFDANPLVGNWPVIVYAPSFQASSIENFALFEFLASKGYVVISSPSRGTETRWLAGGTAKDLETQSRDIEILIKEIQRYDEIDSDNMALMGFSFGGVAATITAMKNRQIKAFISLDGTERYKYGVLAKSPYFDLEKMAVPYVHFAQKDIPDEVLVEDSIPAELNHTFQLYDSLRHSNAYSYKLHDLTHSYFSSYGVLFANRDKRQDKSDAKIMQSYRLLANHTLQFLNAFLKRDKEAKAFIENAPKENGFSEALISKKMKKAAEKEFDYKDFNDLALHRNYQDLIALYQREKAKHPNLTLEEGMLNTLGLRLSFDPHKKEAGIQVFVLALHLYPKSANLYDSLAEAYFHHKDYKNAAANFKKSLALNPQNQNAIDRLKQLKEYD